MIKKYLTEYFINSEKYGSFVFAKSLNEARSLVKERCFDEIIVGYINQPPV